MTEYNHLHERIDQYDKTFPKTNGDGITLEDVNAEITKQLINYVTQTVLNTILADYYNKDELNSKLVSVYKYVGTVANVSQLPSDSTVGYVYNVLDTGMNYAWNGTEWDALGSEVDLTNYVTNTDYATSAKGGVIKFSTSHGVNMSSDGFLMGATRTAEQYNSNSGNMLINKGTLENVFTSKAETWEFTLSDGSTVTKKIVCM